MLNNKQQNNNKLKSHARARTHTHQHKNTYTRTQELKEYIYILVSLLWSNLIQSIVGVTGGAKLSKKELFSFVAY